MVLLRVYMCERLAWSASLNDKLLPLMALLSSMPVMFPSSFSSGTMGHPGRGASYKAIIMCSYVVALASLRFLCTWYALMLYCYPVTAYEVYVACTVL